MKDDREESGFEETLELLREAHREPIPEAHYAAVRARVLTQLQVERRPWRRSVWAYGFALAAAILLLALWPKHSMPKHAVDRPPVITTAATQTVESTPVTTTAHGKLRPHVRRIHRRHPVLTAAAYQVIGPPSLQPLVVKLITNDPNIVIYWISGE